jgi:pSer/pThr/pTyr-binding forkhead associated (FHA) protein
MVNLIVKAPVSESERKDFKYDFDQPVITIGRLKENDLPLPLSTISGFHAQILKEGENYYLLDRGSINGTFLNNQRLVAGEKKLIHDGDVIRIQSFEIYFSAGAHPINFDSGATVQVARQMVMEVLGSWESKAQDRPRVIIMGGPNNGKQFELAEQKVLTAGRDQACDITIDHPSVSRKHTEISFTWSGAFIKDLNSSNGVYVNDQRISGQQKLHDRDEIRLGQQSNNNPIRLVFSNPAEALLSQIQEKSTNGKTKVDDGKLPPPPAAPASEGAAQIPEGAGSQFTVPGPAITVSSQGAPGAPAQVAAGPTVVAPEGPRTKKQFQIIPAMLGGLILIGAVVGIFMLLMRHSSTAVINIDTVEGFPGQTIAFTGEKFEPTKVQNVRIFGESAPIMKRDEHRLEAKIPEFRGLDSVKETQVVLEGTKGVLGSFAFKLMPLPVFKSIQPNQGAAGSDVKIRTNVSVPGFKIYFGNNLADIRSTNGTELVVKVPKPSAAVPVTGVKLPVTVRLNDRPIQGGFDFTITGEKPRESESFQLVFSATAPPTPLGFNEYAVQTNIGPLLVFVSRDEFGTSRERAEKTAENLNNAIDVFRSEPTEKVTLVKKDGAYSIHAQSDSGDDRLLLNVFQDDALAYGKLNGRIVDIEELGIWWQMLLDAYFKVFIQVTNPAGSGILSSGGGIFQQIYNYYPVNLGELKYYKNDFLTALSNDQKTKLLALSTSLPRAVAKVDGKWNGNMSNILYSNISDGSINLVLTFHQNEDGHISGNAEVNWKIDMGSGSGGFQNVAYRRLGTFGLNGSYDRTKSFPLQFSFVEKDGRRLNFVGRLEGDTLGGSFIVSSNGAEGNWSARPSR